MKICFLFPGYGSQCLGMGKELYDNFRIVQEYFEEASNCLNLNFVRLCFASSEAELSKIENAFVSIFLIHSSIAALLQQEKIKPDIIIGHDLGDYAALHAAGGISVPDALYLLSKYAHFYSAYTQTLKVKAYEISGLSTLLVKQLCTQISNNVHTVSLAIVYNQHTSVITGIYSAVEIVRQQAELMGATVQEYSIVGGLYSNLMEPVVTHLTAYVEKVDFKDLSIPLIMNTDGRLIEKGLEVKQRFFEQLRVQLSWDKTMQKMRDIDIIIQIGSKNQLTERILKKYAHKQIILLHKLSDIQKLQDIIKLTKQMYCIKNGLEYGSI